MSVATAIKRLRLSMALEQDDFGKLLNTSANVICSWEKGRRKPRLPTIRAMADLAKKHKLKFALEDFIE